MRTALVLLFLLALAAVPGSLLPQRSLSATQVAGFFRDHPTIAPVLDDLYLFDVFASPWFAAVYLLLFISLIGCVAPRAREHLRTALAPPPPAPRHLHRLPDSATLHSPTSEREVLAAAGAVLRGRRYRVVVRDGHHGPELSAEKGHLKETGNVVFHLALLALLVSLAVGKLWGYEGSILVTEGRGFCNTLQQYDNYRSGPLVDTGSMTPLCADLEDFRVTYEADGTPARFRADLLWGEPGSVTTPTTIGVNNPLRTDGARVYVTGHGFAPTFTATLPDGTALNDISAPFLPSDTTTMASQGALKLPDLGAGLDGQLAVEGFFAPTGDVRGGVLTSVDPRPLDPEVALVVYRGYLGLDSGTPQSVFSVDQARIDRGQLVQVGSGNLEIGESITLDDGTTITFTGYQRFAALQVSHDPGQVFVLASAVALLSGLLLMLLVGRTRVFVRTGVGPDGGTEVAVGSLRRGSGDGGHAFGELLAQIEVGVRRAHGR
jgi:cytochrome c biogenesis protein